MKKIGVIGVGIMGHGIADNFLKNGYEVYLWNRTIEKVNDLKDKGATVLESPKAVATEADIIFEVTANDESSKNVWYGTDGILAAPSDSKSYITCATLSVEWIEELSEECVSEGIDFFDMPMTGGRKGAESGQLILLVGGNKEKLNEIRDELKAVAKEVKYFGPVSSGTKYKLILNSVQAVHIVAFGEAMQMARKVGLDETLVGEALSQLPGGYTTQLAWQCYQKEPEPINFSVDWEAKDLDYAVKMTDETYPLRDKAKSKFDQARSDGLGNEDWTKVNRI